MIELCQYVDEAGRSPFERWFAELDAVAFAKVTVALTRLGEGNLASLKSVGSGVLECRVDFGPGYRVYLGRDGDCLIILLLGGTKKRQQQDIRNAQGYWLDYKKRRKAK